MMQRLGVRATLWLTLLGPFFIVTYTFANSVASQRAHVPSLMFPWERYIPFLPWTILPYWSSDLLYVFSLFLCRTRDELDLHAKRLLTIQIFSVACFLVFPLRAAFERPVVHGWAGFLFDVLRSFDLPSNQAPSLHASLAVIYWACYRRHVGRTARKALAVWFGLMVASTLTTHQHQFIDVPTGLWAGLLVMAALPERRPGHPHVRVACSYAAAALACTIAAFVLRGFAWLLLWPGFSLSLVAAAYWTGDPLWLGKRSGRPALWMLPYTLAAWINSRLWTRGQATKNHLAADVWIGRAPSAADREGMNSVVDLTAEMPLKSDAHVAMLDLVPPTHGQLDAAVRAIAELSGQRPTLICCALGYSRSAIAAAAWLVAAGHASSAEEALRQVSRARPQVVLPPELVMNFQQWADRRDALSQRLV
ncbi:MAG TPA: hypothetical protein VGN17_26290 [Bryobacteraceae bacterium]|jgi:protein-tyrosine phosphatase